MAVGTGWFEIERSYDRGVADAQYWTGVRRYVGPKSTLDDSVTELDGATWSTPESVTLIPRKLRIFQNAREGGYAENSECAEIEVQYRSAYNPITHPVGTATLAVYTRPFQYRQKEDIAGLVIEGPHKTKKRHYFKVVNGSNIRFKHLTVFQIRTAFDITEQFHKTGKTWATFSDLLDKINNAEMSKLGIGIGQARLINVSIPKYFLYNSPITHVPTNFTFWYSSKHWNKLYDDATNFGTCRSQLFYKGPKSVPVIDTMDMSSTESLTYIHKDTLAAGASEANAKLVIREDEVEAKMAAAQNNGYRDLFDEDDGDFASLDAKLWWTITV